MKYKWEIQCSSLFFISLEITTSFETEMSQNAENEHTKHKTVAAMKISMSSAE